MNREPPFLLKVNMNPNENIVDFIKMVYPKQHQQMMIERVTKQCKNIKDDKVSRMIMVDMMDMMTYPVAVVKDFKDGYAVSYPNTFVGCAKAPAEAKSAWTYPCKNKKEEIPMSSSYSTATVITADSVEQTQRRTLRDFAYEAFEAKKTAARKQFGLVGDDAPETMEEAIARILAGKYVLSDKNKERCAYSFMSYISWRDPSIVEDKDGYKAAKAVLQTAYDKLALRLNILPLQDALAEVEAYSAK